MKGNSFQFKAQIWRYDGAAAWHFVTLPSPLAITIREVFEDYKKGWGSIPVHATIKQLSWKTSIFPDKKSQSFLLPLKADIRKNLNIAAGDEIKLTIEILT
jgi:hypothetical protein